MPHETERTAETITDSDQTITDPERQQGPPGLRAWLGLAVLALPVALLGMDLSVLHFAVPQLSADLAPTAPQLLWIVDIYGFLIVGLLITMGSLGDRIGRRRLLLFGAAAFGLASVLAAFAPNAELLIAARALLGVAGATLMPSTLSLLRVMFVDAKYRAIAIGFWTAGFTGGATLGPLIGGAMLSHFWWGSVFLLGVPIVALLLVFGPILLPEYRNSDPEPLDLLSAGLLLAGTLGAIYGIKEFAAHGVAPGPLLIMAGGALLGVLFVRRQRRLASPLLDLALFSNRIFSASLGTVLVGTVTYAGAQFLIAQYLQSVLGLAPLQAGLWTLPAAGVNLVLMLSSPLLARRIPLVYLITGSLLLMAAGMLLLSPLGPGADLPTVVLAFAMLAGGIGPIAALATNLITNAAPPEKTGAAAGILETTSELGVSLGIAILGSLAAAVYRGTIAVPGDVPLPAAEVARETIGGAAGAATNLPPAAGEALLTAAETAFVHGLEAAAGAGAAVLMIMAIVAFMVLRRADQ